MPCTSTMQGTQDIMYLYQGCVLNLVLNTASTKEHIAQRSVFKSNLTKTGSWFRQLICLINCRYSQNGVKVTTPVVFPLEGLDMSEYTHLDPCEQCLYDLTGCVYHQGSKYFVGE